MSSASRDMAESSALNSGRIVMNYSNGDDIVKKEDEVITIKIESLECLVCTSRTRDCFDIYTHKTTTSGASVHQFILKYTQGTAVFTDCTKFVCKGCYDLINILEQTEAEYLKLKETFEDIISKNPFFELVEPGLNQTEVKDEETKVDEDSEDEPLARTKKTRNGKAVKKKKTIATKRQKKKVDSESWACDECEASGDTGGGLSLAAHKLTMHTLPVETAIKTEDGSQSPFNNDLLEETMAITFDNENDYDDDNDSTFNPDEFTEEIDKKKKVKIRNKKITEKKPPKVMHSCDQCNARYSSIVRLESHKQKHDGSKPPYICEVCGAHYKHKRACDIHIALHKGISDWKCEECNKLFPSKNALQRHNNIHTGKLNYQCDLCGKSFIHTSSFKMHKLTHSGVKPHSCDVCGLALMTRSHLKRHKRIHSGEKRHECTVCGKRFSERYNLVAHQKSHEATGPAVPPEPRRRLFRCHFCVDRFERRYMLERHMSVVHGRALERPPPTPRNTMSKLLKQRAQRPAHHEPESSEAKDERSSESRTPTAPSLPVNSKLLAAQLSSSSSIISASAWNGAYAAEFGIRPDFPH